MRDITLEDTFRFPFTTRAFATGVPTVLAGTPVLSVLEENNATPITAGVTVSVDRASVVGLNEGTVIATAANGYETGKSYGVYISTGTVGGVSVIGEVVHEFTIGLSAAFTRLGAPAGASVSADIAVIEGQTDDIGVAGAGLTAINLPDQTMNITGNLSGSVGSVTADVGITAQAVDDVWDEVLTGATHNVTNSSGKRLRAIAGTVFREGTAQAGSFNTITLDTGASAIDNFFKNMSVFTVEGTGAQQQRIIIDYDGTTKVATISPQWVTIPDATSEFEVVPGIVHAAGTNLDLLVGHAVASTATTIDLNGDASAIDGFYDMQLISIHDGVGAGQARSITAYNGTTKIATINRAWDTNPDTTSEYVITATIGEDAIADAVWDELLAGHVVADSSGLLLNDWQDGGRLDLLLDAIPTTAMRGTDSAALASVCTETRLAELDAAKLPAGVDAAVALFTTQLTEAYAADGVAPTPAQALFLIQQMLGDFGIAGTTLTVREIDGATTAATFTLDDGTNPTDITRAT